MAQIIRYFTLIPLILLQHAAGQTAFRISGDCSLKYVDTGSSIGREITGIKLISLPDTSSVISFTKYGKRSIELKIVKQLTATGESITGMSVGYGALIGSGLLGTLGFVAALAENDGTGAPIFGGAGLLLGAGIGSLVGLFIVGMSSEPDILVFPDVLSKTDRREQATKFLKRINF